MALAAFAVGSAGGPGLLFQAVFRASGTGAIDRTAMSKLRDTVSVKDFGAPCDGVADDSPATTLAIAALPAGGGTLDARPCASMTLGSTLTISKAAVTILLPATTIAMGAHQIVVPVGIHNVSLIGSAPYGGSIASQTAGNGTFLTYTGTGPAIKVGDVAADTYGFMLQDVTIGLSTAGTAAIGIQINRTIEYTLSRPRVHGFVGANTQVAIDLEGGANFTGGKIDSPYLWNGNTGIFYGNNANANTVIGGVIINNVSGGICHNFKGVTNSAAGNTILGGDCEPLAGTALNFDGAINNSVFGLHIEAATLAINATASSGGNLTILNNGAVNTVIDVGGAGTVNQFFTTANTTLAGVAGTLWEFKNRTDATTNVGLWAGATTGQSENISYRKWDGGVQWILQKDASENWQVVHNTTAINRLQFTAAGVVFLNSESTGAIGTNLSANSGTGGVIFGSGGASPTQAAKIVANGSLVQAGIAFAALGTPANGMLIYCTDCTIANPCAAAGTGAFAKRLNGVWVCN